MHKYHLPFPSSKFFRERERGAYVHILIITYTAYTIGTWPLIGRWSCCWCSSFGSWCAGPRSLGNLTGFEGIRSFEIRQNLVLRCHRPLEGMAEPWKTKHYHKVSRLKLSSRYREDLSGSLGQWGQDGGFQLPIFAGMISLRATSCILLVPVFACTSFILHDSVQPLKGYLIVVAVIKN